MYLNNWEIQHKWDQNVIKISLLKIHDGMNSYIYKALNEKYAGSMCSHLLHLGLLRVSRLHSYRPGILPEGEETQCENEHNGMLFTNSINHCFDAGKVLICINTLQLQEQCWKA
jgi:hypothetical protein